MNVQKMVSANTKRALVVTALFAIFGAIGAWLLFRGPGPRTERVDQGAWNALRQAHVMLVLYLEVIDTVPPYDSIATASIMKDKDKLIEAGGTEFAQEITQRARRLPSKYRLVVPPEIVGKHRDDLAEDTLVLKVISPSDTGIMGVTLGGNMILASSRHDSKLR